MRSTRDFKTRANGQNTPQMPPSGWWDETENTPPTPPPPTGGKKMRDVRPRTTRGARTSVKSRQSKGSLIVDNDFKKNSKYVKDQLISNYESALRVRYKLSVTEYNKMVSLIKLGFQFKSVSPDDIIFENGEITGISGLVFNEKTRKFSIPRYGTKISPKTCKKTTVDKFGSRMDKLISDNRARIEKYAW